MNNNLKSLYIAHRGIWSNNIIENTIPAFSLALSKNIPIEFDIHILKDGNLVVYHDDNLNRLMNIDRNIDSYTYDELKKITFPDTNIHIPLFEEVLKLVNGKVLLVIEVKKTNLMSPSKYCKRILEVLNNYNHPFVIKSFDIRIVHWFLKNTNYTTGLLIANRKKSLYDHLMHKKIIISTLKPDFLSVDYHILKNKNIKNYRNNHPVLAWTIRSKEKLDKVKDYADSYLLEKWNFFD